MSGRRDGITNQWYFDSVQEFWDAAGLEGHTVAVQEGSFVGQLRKGVLDHGRLRELRREDLESGVQPDVLIVVQVINLERAWNWDRLESPPPRSGKLSAFMDEVQEVASVAGCRYVWVKDVANEFLPDKLKDRGYDRLPTSGGSPNPDYVKSLRRNS